MTEFNVPTHGEITGLLDRLTAAEPDQRRLVLDELIPLIYHELKLLAKSQRFRWSGQGGYGTTSLVHEAYTRLAGQQSGGFANRREFFGLAATTMRSVLIDNARWHQRKKRGGNAVLLPLDEGRLVSEERSEDLLALDAGLTDLESRQPELARIVECRCFGGLTIEETGEALELSAATVKRRWNLARAWLFRALEPNVRTPVSPT